MDFHKVAPGGYAVVAAKAEANTIRLDRAKTGPAADRGRVSVSADEPAEADGLPIDGGRGRRGANAWGKLDA